ncbi:MAG: hypothetical protein KDE58_42970, partial [Caldilineaceae bacterium]|nr:hypothetical protein [Caldilineaceae bacterium]
FYSFGWNNKGKMERNFQVYPQRVNSVWSIARSEIGCNLGKWVYFVRSAADMEALELPQQNYHNNASNSAAVRDGVNTLPAISSASLWKTDN